MDNKTSIRINDEKPCFEIRGTSVDIHVNARRQEHGSSRVKLKNIVDYKWEVKKYHGRLIAVHRDGQVVAYSIKLKTGGTVRVWWNGERALIKGMANEVLDIQFAHMSTKIILACVDESSLHIYHVETRTGKLETSLLLKVDNPVNNVDPRSNRINWCPFVPSTEEDDDTANHLLVWSQGNTFQGLNVHLVLESHGTGGSFDYTELSEGVVQHRESSALITAATFSPDGTTLAVGFDDGNVCFYQIYLYSKETAPRRLYNWKPHEQKPVTALAFLDDHTARENSSFWKHALTATDNNTEIKLWRCDDWSCIQRICFVPATAYDTSLDFKLDIDASSSYLVLSEQNNRVLYVLQMAREDDNCETGEEGSSKGKVTSTVSFKSVGEFPLSSSILSFNIAGATKGKYNCGRLEDDADEYDEEANPMFGVMIQMFLVQPKSVQECHVFFQTENPSVPDECVGKSPTSSTSQIDKSLAYSVNQEMVKSPSMHCRQKSSAQINLMTPESFQSISTPEQPASSGVSNSVLTTIRMLAASATNNKGESRPHESFFSYGHQNNSLINSLEPRMSSNLTSSTVHNSEILPSGSSSPSREVQEILSLKDEMFENVQANDMLLDDELEANSCDGISNEIDVAAIADRTSNGSSEEEGKKMEKVIDEINAIKLYVDDDDEDNEPRTEICSVNLKWPKLPNILPDMALLQNGANQAQRSTLKAAVSGNNVSLETDCKKFETNRPSATSTTVVGSSSSAESKLDRILEMLNQNSEQITNLERRLNIWEKEHKMREETSNRTDNCAKPNDFDNPLLSVFDANLNKSLDSHIVRCEKLIKYELDEVCKKQTKQQATMREQLLQIMSQMTMHQHASKDMATNLFMELQPKLMKLVAGEMEAIKATIEYEVATKLSVSDNLLKENLSYVCSNKSFIETFVSAVRSAVQQTAQSTFKEQIQKMIIPAYERTSKEMFKQTNEMFQNGVHNYSKQVQSYMTMFNPVHDQQEKLLSMMSILPEQFKSTNEKVINSFSAQIIHEVNKDFKTLQLNILKVIKQEVCKGFESQAANLEDSVLSVVRSQAQTPSVFDIQEQIRATICQGQINKAFHQALISNDLTLVEFTLENADIKEVFNPCHLEQPVLLSLIQQLSADMSAYTPKKYQYLSEAITSLNTSDSVIKEHAPKILKQLSKNLHKYMNDHPNCQFGSRIKMLQMMIAGAGFSTQPAFT